MSSTLSTVSKIFSLITKGGGLVETRMDGVEDDDVAVLEEVAIELLSEDRPVEEIGVATVAEDKLLSVVTVFTEVEIDEMVLADVTT